MQVVLTMIAGSASAIQSQVESSYDLVLDPEEFADIDFLVPGKITYAGLPPKLISVAESRRDCIAVVSPQRSDVINSNTSTKKTDAIIDFFNTLASSSYMLFSILDISTFTISTTILTVISLCWMLQVSASTPQSIPRHGSPAGYNRGNLRNATKLAYSPKQSERDRLYTARINPVVSFPGQGIVLFGDKTALSSPSAFDRINVRRLFIELEKNIARFSKFQLFEINDEITHLDSKVL